MQTTDENRPSTESEPRSLARATAMLTFLPVPLIVVVVVVLLLVSPVHVLAIAVLVLVPGAVWAVFVRRSIRGAEQRILTMLAPRDATNETHARLHNVVEGLCLTMGMTKPRLMTIESEALVACAVAGPQSAGCLLVSSGLSDSLDRIEHEAIVAHLLWRLRSGDILARTLSIACADALTRFGIGGLVSSVLGKSGEVTSLHEADLSACTVTRYPPGLMSALVKIADGPVVRGNSLRRTAPLWVADEPLGDAADESGIPRVGGVRLSIDERVELLKEI